MVETDVFEEVVYHLSESEVNEAYALAAERQQRLYDISVSTTTGFHFCVPYNEHFALVVVVVEPYYKDLPYPVFNITARYQPCCTAAGQDNQTDERFKSDLQTVYDTYIRPIWRKFDDGCRKKIPPSVDSSFTCQQRKKQYALKSRSCEETDWLRAQEPCAKDHEVGIQDPKDLSLSCTDATTGLTRQTSGHHADCATEHSVGERRGAIISGQGKSKRASKNTSSKQIADTIVDKIRRGIKAIHDREAKKKKKALIMKRREKRAVRSLHLTRQEAASYSQQWLADPIRSIVLHVQPNHNDKRDNTTIWKELEQGFIHASDQAHLEGRTTWWALWYFGACFSLTLYLNRKRSLDRRVTAVRVIHRILDKLLVTDGIRAAMILSSLAETGFTLYAASHASDNTQEEISEIVAQALRGDLGPPPGDYMIPIPAVWFSLFSTISYRDACYALEIKHLAELQVEPVWVTLLDGNAELLQCYQYSFLETLWKDCTSTETSTPQRLPCDGFDPESEHEGNPSMDTISVENAAVSAEPDQPRDMLTAADADLTLDDDDFFASWLDHCHDDNVGVMHFDDGS